MIFAFGFWMFCGFFSANGQDRVVHIYGWSDYIDPRVIEDFIEETGIKVTYDAYASDESLATQFEAGKSSFDVVIVSGRVLHQLIAADRVLRLEKNRLPNSKNLWPDLMAQLALFDPGNQFAVNYLWFTTGLAYNIERAKQNSGFMSADAATVSGLASVLASWNMLFKPENLKKFSSCGVGLLENPEALFAIAMQYLGLDPHSTRQTDLKRAADLLGGIQRNVTKLDSTDYADALTNGDICLAVGTSVESLRARDRARESGNGIEIDYVIPREGAPILLDNLAISKGASHVEEAYAFIDFLLRPEIAARNTNYTHLANGVLASMSLIDKTISANPSIYPGPAVMQRLFAVGNHDPAVQKVIAHEWERIKSGK